MVENTRRIRYFQRYVSIRLRLTSVLPINGDVIKIPNSPVIQSRVCYLSTIFRHLSSRDVLERWFSIALVIFPEVGEVGVENQSTSWPLVPTRYL